VTAKAVTTTIPLGRALLRGSSDLPGGLAHRAGTRSAEAKLPPYLVLLRVGFALPATLLPRRCALTAPFHPYLAAVVNARAGRALLPAGEHKGPEHRTIHNGSGAVCFLWHFPSTSLDAGFPDVIRHTALWSSDFPPPPLDATRAVVRSSCLRLDYSRGDFPERFCQHPLKPSNKREINNSWKIASSRPAEASLVLSMSILCAPT
jgi:hypothetical protein